MTNLSDTTTHTYFEKNTVARDLLRMCVGEFLGSGHGREVFVFKPDPSLVIKFETTAGSFQNTYEWGTWDRISEVKHVAQWFAPPVRISECGTILLQRRAEKLRDDEYPERVPVFMTDLKKQNWGKLDGRPVCLDFGVHLLIEHGMSKRLKRADWWDING